MFKQKIFIISFILLIIIAVFNYLGVKFYLYWVYRWYDIPMHMLGGLWVSLFTLSVYSYFYKNVSILNYRRKVFTTVFIVLIFVIIFWEAFELVGGITSWNNNGYWMDTLGDILNGFIGGTMGYLFFIRNKKCNVDLGCDYNSIIK